MITPEARARLAEKMEERRLELRLTWREVAEAGEISYEVVRNVRNGRGTGIAPLTKEGIEAGLRWERGSVDRTLAGGDPVPAAAPDSASNPFTVLADRHGLDLEPHRRVIQQRIDAAQAAFPGEVPPGSLVLDDPEMIAQWDLLASKSYADGQRFTVEQLRDTFAMRLAQRDKPERNSATGLTMRR